ncbi:glycosyltransferase [Oscillibacter valericigenes Sjm18-20]|nr:glycosyltransferase [Oscillibacter valericigenes Sjm18-20]
MKICFMTLGTRGDVQPCLALAKKMTLLGNEAVICTSESFRDFIQGEGILFAKANLDLMAVAATSEGKAVLEAPIKNMALALKISKEVITPGYRATFDDFYEAAKGCDVIVYHPKAFVAADIALKLDIPCVSMPPIPITYPIAEFPCVAVSPKNNYGKFMNKLTYRFNEKAEAGYIKAINDFRAHALGFPKRKVGQFTYAIDGREIPILYPVSKYLFDDVSSWNGHVYLSGFFYLDSKEKLSNRLDSFLGEGEKPIAISFSSMPLKKPQEFIRKLDTALEVTGNRAVLLTGNSGIDFAGNERIFIERQAPHTLLFARSSAVIHHGGAGTTAAALAAGIPQLLMPFSVDQPFWAQRIYKSGVSPAPIRESSLTGESLAKMFLQFEEQNLREKAMVLGELIRNENGLQNAAEMIQRIVNTGSWVL